MSEQKQCPLCGKPINEDDSFCEECQNHVDNQYTTDFLDTEDLPESDTSEFQVSKEGEEAVSERVVVFEAPEVVNNQPEKRGLSSGVIFLLIGCLLVVIIGVVSVTIIKENRESIETEERFWNKCVEENTPVSYAKYLVSFQKGKYVEEANKRIKTFREAEVQAWEKLKKSSDINDFYAYLGENPKTPHINQIRLLMDSLSWLSTTKDNTADSYQAYIENVNLGNVSGEHIDMAKERYTYLSQIRTLEGASLDSIQIEVDRLLKVMSEHNPKDLLKIFADKAFYHEKDLSSTEIVAAISSDIKEKNIKEIIYTPKKGSLKAKRDNKGVLFVDLIVNKEITYNTKIKKGKKSENKKETVSTPISFELSKENQILSIK